MPALPEWMKGHGLNALFVRREALGALFGYTDAKP